MTEEARNRYFDELSICLSRNGYTTQEPEDGRLPVEQDGVPLCCVDENGTKYLAVLSVEQPENMTDALRLAMELDDYEQMTENIYEYGQEALRRIGSGDAAAPFPEKHRRCVVWGNVILKFRRCIGRQLYYADRRNMPRQF